MEYHPQIWISSIDEWPDKPSFIIFFNENLWINEIWWWNIAHLKKYHLDLYLIHEYSLFTFSFHPLKSIHILQQIVWLAKLLPPTTCSLVTWVTNFSPKTWYISPWWRGARAIKLTWLIWTLITLSWVFLGEISWINFHSWNYHASMD